MAAPGSPLDLPRRRWWLACCLAGHLGWLGAPAARAQVPTGSTEADGGGDAADAGDEAHEPDGDEADDDDGDEAHEPDGDEAHEPDGDEAPGAAGAPPRSGATRPGATPAGSPRRASRLAVAGAGVPGLGHLLLGEPVAAGLIFTGTVGLLGSSFLVDSTTSPLKMQGRGFFLAEGGTALWLWSAWDAYQLAQRRPREGPGGYQSIGDLAAAPFSPAVLTRPDVFFPLLLVGLFASTGTSFTDDGSLFALDQVTLFDRPVRPALALPVQEAGFALLALEAGVGEEAFFRGLLLDLFSQGFGPALGNFAQATVFGLMHLPNPYLLGDGGTVEDSLKTALLTGVLGGYLGHLTHRHAGDLRPAVAFHFWYNFLLLTMAYLGDPQQMPLRLQIAFPW